MRSIIVIFLFLGIIISGCIQNPVKQVPVVKVNITLTEKQGKFYSDNYTMTQGKVDYAGRPKNTLVKSFPAISSRTMVVRNNTNGTMDANGPWENLPFKGNGTYNFNIGFNENYYPDPGDLIHISIIISNEKAKRIGYIVENKVWE